MDRSGKFHDALGATGCPGRPRGAASLLDGAASAAKREEGSPNQTGDTGIPRYIEGERNSRRGHVESTTGRLA
jgi:hypothetical protein